MRLGRIFSCLGEQQRFTNTTTTTTTTIDTTSCNKNSSNNNCKHSQTQHRRVVQEEDQATGSPDLLEADRATASTYLLAYISWVHCTSVSVSSFYPKTNKLLATSLRLLLAALANINDSSNNNNINNRAAGTLKINVLLNRFGSFWSCVSRKV